MAAKQRGSYFQPTETKGCGQSLRDGRVVKGDVKLVTAQLRFCYSGGIHKNTMKRRIRTSTSKTIAASLALGALMAVCAPAQAAVVGYQSLSDFNTAISGWSTLTTNFDSIATNTTYSTGSGPTGSGFTLALTGGSDGYNLPAIGSAYWTTSGANYLGLNNSDTALEAGDTLTFSFATARHAFGLFVIGGADLQAGDIRLTSGTASIANAATAVATDNHGSYAYFLGFASNDASTFSSVKLDYASLGLGAVLPIAIDDVVLASNTSPVPEPGTLAMMVSGLLLLSGRARRQIS